MSKTLGHILNIITGPLTLIDRDLGNAVRTAALTIIGNAILPGVGSFIGASIGGALSRLDAPGAPRPPQTETALKSPTPPRVSGYGRGRFYIVYALYVTASDGTAVDVGAFHDGRADGIEGYYLADTKIVVLFDGRVQAGEAGQFGELSDIVKVYTRLGLPTEAAFTEVIAKVPDRWSSNHRGDGVVTAAVLSAPVSSKNFQMIYPTGGPNQMPLSLVLRCQLVFDWRDSAQSPADPSTWKWSENPVLHLAHYKLVRENKDWATHFLPTLSYWTAAANDCDSPVPLKGVQAILLATANHGSTSVTVNSANGLIAGTSISISVTGDTSLSESRTVSGVTPGGGGYVVSFSGPLANDHPVGSQVVWSGSGASEPRYRGCVAHKHTDAHKDVCDAILSCFDGWLAPRADGALVVYSGRYYAATVTIGPDEIISYSLQDGLEEENAVNQIAVSYVSANHDFNVVDTDAWEDPDDIARRGKVLADALAVQSPSFSQNRRLAKRAMAKKNAPKRGTVSTNAAGRIVRGQRYIRLQLIDAGTVFYDGPVEISRLVRNIATGGVTFDWQLADPSIDAWNPDTEEGLPAPVGNRVATEPLNPPTISSAVADFSDVSDDGTGVRLSLVVAGPNRADLVWFARWRIVGAAVWNESRYTDIDPGASVALETGFVPAGRSVEVEAAYEIGDGRVSPYSDPVPVDTSTSGTPPDAATSITLVSWTDTLNLTADRISRASSYRWRFYDTDGTTLLRTIVTAARTVSYAAAQAAIDGVRRSYIVEVAGVNSAGAGTAVRTGTISNPAPAALTGFSLTGGSYEGESDFDLSADPDVAGYVTYVSTVSGFDPFTAGTAFKSLGSPAYLQALAAGTFYAKAAAYDAWSDNPGLLNFTSEQTFAITTGGGGVGGGGGGGGGGYCVTIDTPILMADADGSGPGDAKVAGDLVVGDLVWTQHEQTMAWNAYPISAVSFVEDDVLSADIGSPTIRATADHRLWLSGWVRMEEIGAPCGRAMVAKITVDDAHTYVSAGVLSHNIKARDYEA